MTTKLVIRLLDADGQMLGWCQHEAAVKGDGCLRAASPIACVLDVDGTPAQASIHWVDLNSEVRVPVLATVGMQVGQSAFIAAKDAVIFSAGMPAARLAPVTMKTSVTVGVPVGHLGSTGSPTGGR